MKTQWDEGSGSLLLGDDKRRLVSFPVCWSLDFNWARLYTVDRMYIQIRLAQNLTRPSQKLLLRKPRTVCTALTGFLQPRQSVYSVVRTEYLNEIPVNFRLRRVCRSYGI